MSKIKLVTDASCSLPVDVAEKEDVKLLESIIMIEDKSYRELSELSREDFVNSLRTIDPYPTSAQASVQDALDVLEQAVKDGYDEVLYLGITPQISAQLNSVRLASRKVKDKIKVTIYSTDLTLGSQGGMALRAISLLKQGKTTDEIVAYLDTIKEKVYTLSVGPDFFTVFRTGRVKKGVGLTFAASTFKLKPIGEVNTKDGIIAIGAGLGYGGATKKMMKLLEERTDPSLTYDLIMKDALNPKLKSKMEKEVKKIRKINKTYDWELTPVVALSGGKGNVMFSVIPVLEE